MCSFAAPGATSNVTSVSTAPKPQTSRYVGMFEVPAGPFAANPYRTFIRFGGVSPDGPLVPIMRITAQYRIFAIPHDRQTPTAPNHAALRGLLRLASSWRSPSLSQHDACYGKFESLLSSKH